MAIGNWDRWGLTLDGAPSNGAYRSSGGVTVELYKDWLYLRQGDGPPLELREGQIEGTGLKIVARRVPFAVIFVVSEYHAESSQFTGMVGVGAYGYREAECSGRCDCDGAARVGVTCKQRAALRELWHELLPRQPFPGG